MNGPDVSRASDGGATAPSPRPRKIKAIHRCKLDADSRLAHCGMALALLDQARRHLTAAGARNAARYVARARKSAQGAENHARRRAQEGRES